MQKRSSILILFTLFLAGIYIYFFTDWFEKKQIQIKFRNLAGRGGNVTFYLDREYPLTSVRVISVAEAITNKYPHDFWNLISDSNSIPLADFVYGEAIQGMKPKITGMTPETLSQTNQYRILIKAGNRKGEKEFRLVEKN